MIEVEALQSFEHSKSRKRGETFEVSERVAAELSRKKLVRVVGEVANPSKAAGGQSSALPVVPASQQTTAKPSAAGGKKRGRPKKVPEQSS